jgi:HTH-type transcriptional regulator / antitoxin HigA
MEEMGLEEKDLLPVFSTELTLSEIMNRQRSLTVEHVEKLAEFFNISPSAFLNQRS